MSQLRSYRCALFISLAGASASLAQDYQVVPLGVLGGAFGAAAQGINSQNEVVGWSDTAIGEFHAFYWSGGTMIDLGTLPGHTESAAFAINDAGIIVGYSADAGGIETAVKWERINNQWQITPLGTLPGGAWSIAWGINGSGAIIGTSSTQSSVYHAFILQNGTMTDLGTPGFTPGFSYSEALGINDAGHVVGYAYRPLWGPDHAWHYDGIQAVDITPIGQFIFARGTGINAAGTASGILIQPGGGSSGFEAATWSAAGGWQELGVLPGTSESEAWAINDSGMVVGRSFDIALNDYRGFVYAGGTMTDLSTLPGAQAPLTEAIAINSAGAILANANTMDGPIAHLLLPAAGPCYPNCDASTSAPILNVADFGCFLGKFAAGDSYANCDGSTQAPVLNVADFSCFLTSFAAGCR